MIGGGPALSRERKGIYEVRFAALRGSTWGSGNGSVTHFSSPLFLVIIVDTRKRWRTSMSQECRHVLNTTKCSHLALYSDISLVTSSRCFSEATCNGVLPSLSFNSASAPWSRRRRTTLRAPQFKA